MVDVTYDVDRGTYDLTIAEEGQDAPVVSSVDQRNAVGMPGSKLRKFSFIGDQPGLDRSNVRFYVDDIIITAGGPMHQTPFVAPGRMLFVDLYDHCLPWFTGSSPSRVSISTPLRSSANSSVSTRELTVEGSFTQSTGSMFSFKGRSPLVLPWRLSGRASILRAKPGRAGKAGSYLPQAVRRPLQLANFEQERDYPERIYGRLDAQ